MRPWENPWDMAQIFPPTLFFRKKGKYDFLIVFSKLQRPTIL